MLFKEIGDGQNEETVMSSIEETILRTAHAYEQATEWHKMRPSI